MIDFPYWNKLKFFLTEDECHTHDLDSQILVRESIANDSRPGAFDYLMNNMLLPLHKASYNATSGGYDSVNLGPIYPFGFEETHFIMH